MWNRKNAFCPHAHTLVIATYVWGLARVDWSTGHRLGSTAVERAQQAGGPGPRLIPVHRGVDPVH